MLVVNIAPADEVLTAREAADLLGVSRPTVVSYALGDRIPARRVGPYLVFRRTDIEAARDLRECRVMPATAGEVR
jgi:excisionase family DNA binding protein